ncbi:restriction endonuclease [Mesorhizobium sp. M0478]|uniref:restriction endonuclease n=1 Tax=Mesorhizobium sp. M0478 TaxID=2956947 RepID=UPI0033358CBE
MSRSWLIRLGKFGEQEAAALASGELATGWAIPNFPAPPTKEGIAAAVQATYPEQKSGTLQNWSVQLNQLANGVQDGDLAIVPLKTTGQIAIGQVTGDFFLNSENRPARRVKWLRTDLPRDAVKQDLLYSLGASQTVCEVQRNDAATRFKVLLQSGHDPGPNGKSFNTSGAEQNTADSLADAQVDFIIPAQDQIERHISANFVGHAFTELVAAILRAQGYQTRVSPPGADKGVDIVAGQGALGLESPRLVVQVKSGDIVVDQPALQSLLGTIQDTHAEYGLLVSWSGFKSSVRQRTNDLYFRVRFWGRQELIEALYSVYDRLPEEIRADLPLRRIWVLVPEA